MTKKHVIDAIRKDIGQRTAKSWAELFGINRTVLADVLSGRREPTDQLCALVGFKKTKTTTTTYRKIK